MKSADPTVSIVIPAYGHANLILETINSVMAQTYSSCEIIVVNDGSPDDTERVLAPLVARGEIKYLKQSNSGAASARNRGLTAATGEFIAFLDDDDTWPVDKLAWQLDELRRDPSISAVAGFFSELGKPVLPFCEDHLTQDWNVTDLFRGCPFISPGMLLFRRQSVIDAGGFDESLWGTDDYDLYLRIAAKGLIRQLPRLSLYYRRHSSNASRNRERLMVNLIKCLRVRLRTLPLKQRFLCGRSSFRYVYRYWGRNLIEMARHRSNNLIQLTFGVGQIVRRLFPYILLDVPLMREIIGDVHKQTGKSRPRQECVTQSDRPAVL